MTPQGLIDLAALVVVWAGTRGLADSALRRVARARHLRRTRRAGQMLVRPVVRVSGGGW